MAVFSIAQALAQTPYSLPQAIDYAMQNSTTVKNATLDIENAKARIGETRAIGLPQISGQAQLQHNFRIQQFIGDGRAGSNPFAGGGPSYYDTSGRAWNRAEFRSRPPLTRTRFSRSLSA